jgi:hypothetical protein
VQKFPMLAVRSELSDYVAMLRDLLRLYANASIYVLAPLYRSQPLWYESVYGETSVLFCSEVSRLDPARVKVVPPVDVSAHLLSIWIPWVCIMAMWFTSLLLIVYWPLLWMVSLWIQISIS